MADIVDIIISAPPQFVDVVSIVGGSGSSSSSVLAQYQIGVGNASNKLSGSNRLTFDDDSLLVKPTTTATDYGTRIDKNGLRVGQVSTLGTSNAYMLELGTAFQFLSDGTIYSGPAQQSFLQLQSYVSQIGNYSTRIIILGSGGLQNIDFQVNNVSKFKITDTQLSSTLLAGTNNRMVEVDSIGNLSTSKEIKSAWITDSPSIALITNVANWNGSGVYTGTTLTNIYQGQQYYNANYFYVAVNDNEIIRMIRG